MFRVSYTYTGVPLSDIQLKPGDRRDMQFTTGHAFDVYERWSNPRGPMANTVCDVVLEQWDNGCWTQLKPVRGGE
jgi:hypothetical protein